MDIHSEGVVPLGSIPDVVGLLGRRPDATGRRILQGRDVRSINVLVPDARGLDQNFHDVTIVDMGARCPFVKTANMEQFVLPWNVRIR